MYRVVAKEGVAVLSSPDKNSPAVGFYSCGDFVRGVEVTRCGCWLRLERARGRLGAFSGNTGGGGAVQEWVSLVWRGSAGGGGRVRGGGGGGGAGRRSGARGDGGRIGGW